MREVAFEIIEETLEHEKHSDAVFHRLVESDSKLSRQVRNQIRRLSYGTIERAIEIDEYIDCVSKTPVKKMNSVIRTILRLGAYELFFMDSIPDSATCNEMVELAKKKGQKARTGFVNGVLRNMAREGYDKIHSQVLSKKRNPIDRMSFEFSMPHELVQMLFDSYGKKTTKKILSSFYEENPLTIRVQTMNATPEEVTEELIKVGVDVKKSSYPKEGFEISNFDRVDNLPGFEEGHFTIQDKSSMLPVMVSGIKPGDCVLDTCSSPGGKALQAVNQLGGTGLVSARDVSEKKIEKIKENAIRLRANNIEIKVWDATNPDPEWGSRADVVLADVPCSGIGVIGKKPEIKYMAMSHSKELVQIQRKIVTGAFEALKPGGIFVYSTCTIHPAENEENVKWILDHFPMKLVSLDDCLPDGLTNKLTREGMLQILPGIHEGDGFFVAKFRKDQNGD